MYICFRDVLQVILYIFASGRGRLPFDCHATNATRRNHFSTFFSFLFKYQKIMKNNVFLYLSPQKETLTDARDGDGGGQTITQNIIQHHVFSIFVFPWKGALTDAGDGDGGGKYSSSFFLEQYVFTELLYHIVYFVCFIYGGAPFLCGCVTL